MSSVRVRRGESQRLGRVDGDLEAEDHCLIQSLEGSRVVVTGKATCEGNVEVDCDLECGSLESSDGMVRVNGGVVVHGDVDVEDALYTRGNLKAGDVDVGGRLSVGISMEARSADVGGSIEVQGNAEADKVDVGGSFEVLGEVKVRELDVGGKVELGGGQVADLADIGGMLVSRKPLKFGRIDAGGTVELAGGEGDSIDVGGKLRSDGDLKCRKVDVGGLVEVRGNLSGEDVDVGGKMLVDGNLDLTGTLDVGGMVEIRGVFTGRDMDIGGDFRASKAVLTGRAEVGRRIDTSKGLKASELELGKGASCTGPIVGGTVDIGVVSRVEDVYCTRLRAERGARLGKVFADYVELEDGCSVDELTYTKELRQGHGVRFQRPPEKADHLPPFPL